MTTRSKQLRALAVGVTMSAFVGGGLFAVLTDEVVSQGNATTSPTYELPAHDLRVAFVDANASCPTPFSNGSFGSPNPAYSSGPLAAYQNGPLTEDSAGFVNNAGNKSICIGNFGDDDGAISVSFKNILSTEVSCERSEEASATDDCTTANTSSDPGELADALSAAFVGSSDTNTPACTGTGAQGFGSFASAALLHTQLDSHEVCRASLDLVLDGTDEQKNDGQTDRLQWDIVFTLSSLTGGPAQDTTTVG